METEIDFSLRVETIPLQTHSAIIVLGNETEACNYYCLIADNSNASASAEELGVLPVFLSTKTIISDLSGNTAVSEIEPNDSGASLRMLIRAHGCSIQPIRLSEIVLAAPKSVKFWFGELDNITFNVSTVSERRGFYPRRSEISFIKSGDSWTNLFFTGSIAECLIHCLQDDEIKNIKSIYRHSVARRSSKCAENRESGT